MRLNHLDILEQCFRDKLRGYSKQEVDTFLHLVADDFKEMTEEIELLTKKLAHKEKIIKELQETREKLEENKNPELDFRGISIPWHLTKELVSYFPKAKTNSSLMLDHY